MDDEIGMVFTWKNFPSTWRKLITYFLEFAIYCAWTSWIRFAMVMASSKSKWLDERVEYVCFYVFGTAFGKEGSSALGIGKSRLMVMDRQRVTKSVSGSSSNCLMEEK